MAMSFSSFASSFVDRELFSDGVRETPASLSTKSSEAVWLGRAVEVGVASMASKKGGSIGVLRWRGGCKVESERVVEYPVSEYIGV